jgi:high-affinity Fe2+/Pb2+ permease
MGALKAFMITLTWNNNTKMIWVIFCLAIGYGLIKIFYHTMFDDNPPSKKNIKWIIVFVIIAILIAIYCISEAKSGPR